MRGQKKHVDALKQGGVEDYVAHLEAEALRYEVYGPRQEDASQRRRDEQQAKELRRLAGAAKNYLFRLRQPKPRRKSARQLQKEQEERDQRRKEYRSRVKHQRELKEAARLKRANARKRPPGEDLPPCDLWQVHDGEGKTKQLEAFNEDEARRLCNELGYTFIRKKNK